MRTRRIRLVFREINYVETKGLKPVMCQSQESPQCLVTYIESRINQPCCVKCMLHLGIQDDFPLISG